MRLERAKITRYTGNRSGWLFALRNGCPYFLGLDVGPPSAIELLHHEGDRAIVRVKGHTQWWGDGSHYIPSTYFFVDEGRLFAALEPGRNRKVINEIMDEFKGGGRPPEVFQ